MHVLSTAGHEHELHALFNTAPDLARYSTIGSSRDADASTSRTARLASSREPILHAVVAATELHNSMLFTLCN